MELCLFTLTPAETGLRAPCSFGVYAYFNAGIVRRCRFVVGMIHIGRGLSEFVLMETGPPWRKELLLLANVVFPYVGSELK